MNKIKLIKLIDRLIGIPFFLTVPHFVGRLAEYKYYNMDQAVKRALDVFKIIAHE